MKSGRMNCSPSNDFYDFRGSVAGDGVNRLLEARARERIQELQRFAFREGQTGVLNRRGFAEIHVELAVDMADAALYMA